MASVSGGSIAASRALQAASQAAITAAFAGAPARSTVDPTANGAKSLATTGSITSGTSTLVLDSDPGFSVNDYICVEIGAEAGAGAPGTMGVGGAWPKTSYATAAALLADHTQPDATFAWAIDTGNVYQWSVGGNAWTAASTSINFNYWYKSIPRALLAKITGKNGLTLTLDTSASATATSANVYFNNSYVVSDLVENGANNIAYVFPAGSFYFAGTAAAIHGGTGSTYSLAFDNKSNILIGGQGKGVTYFRSPKGAICWSAGLPQCTLVTFQNVTCVGNFTLTGGWGFDYENGRVATTNTQPPNIPLGTNFGAGDTYCIAQDVDFQNCVRCVTSGLNASYCAAYRCTSTIAGTLAYMQWPFDWVNSTYCWSYDCVCTSTYLTKTFECFASNLCGHVRPTTTNGVFSLNSTAGCVIDTPTVTITSLSQYQPGTVFTVTINNPIFDTNQNISQNQGGGGNQIINMNVTQQGYINANQDVLIGANAGTGAQGFTVIGGSFSAPNYSGNGNRGPQAVNSDSSNMQTLVYGLTASGTPNPSWGNINVQNGSVHGCVAPQIVCPGGTCSLT